MNKRAPIIVIMGSVDHGKTTLLDYIRKANVAAKEAGGITQSVGAYEIDHNSQRITFIDTPGHEAFAKMKSRGAKIADIAILVVASDDGVQPQTKEAIKIIQEAKLPLIVAINKIDKVPDTAKVKNELMQAGVLLEGYGGTVSNQPISAKTGQGVDELLDLILLTAEVENFTYDPDAQAQGFVLEAKMDNRRGIIATAIVKNGKIRQGDYIKAGNAFGKIKILENFLGKAIKEAIPSSPVKILGFEILPKVGEEFISSPDIKPETKGENKRVISSAREKSENAVRLILKADVSGSLEALSEIVKNLPKKENQAVEIIDSGVGEITDGDIKLAISTKSLIIGFRTTATKAAETLARAQNIKIVQSEIIYELLKAVEETLAGLEKKIIKGKLEILAVFGRKGKQQIIGGGVNEGSILNNSVLEIERKNEIAGNGKVLNLQQNKKDVKEVPAGNECGLLFDSEVEIRVGDLLLMH